MGKNTTRKYILLSELMVLVFITIIFVGGIVLLHPEKDSESVQNLEAVPVIPRMEYGIIVDSLDVIRGRVKKNQFLADILLDHKLDYSLIDRIARSPREVFDVRRIRAGRPYSVIKTLDSVPVLQYFIYEHSPTEYVIIDLTDTLKISRGEKEIERRLTSNSGIITSSLWNTMVEIEADVNLANELSEIYAWTIDFFGIQSGDNFKVVFEELYVDDEYIGLGKVHAAVFNHYGKDHFACYFVQDSLGDYFDDEGGSMRRTFLKAPLRYRRVSSGFSYSRMHPVLKYRRPHLGVDYAAASGTPVHAVGDGVVTMAGWTDQGGYTVKIKHNGTYSTSYCHFSGFGKGIKRGATVKQGQVIGYVGATGLATGPHLDFRFYRNGKAIDPLKVKSPPAKPVDSAYYNEYRIHCDSLIKVLEKIPLAH
ncbi:MAG: peptidoglycan DD-metalloendopeptidase family protein [Bacteroidales bacterium]|nr:peptidoglycan DD-metalloendopeptidase family protein [Bacteroidales bacterium]